MKRKFGKIAEEFKQYDDDRLLVSNMFGQLLEACQVMENIGNSFIRVAFNESCKKQEAQMEAIIMRFTGNAYKDGRWQKALLYHVYEFEETEEFAKRRNVLIKSTTDRESAFHLAKQLSDMGRIGYIDIEQPDGKTQCIWY